MTELNVRSCVLYLKGTKMVTNYTLQLHCIVSYNIPFTDRIDKTVGYTLLITLDGSFLLQQRVESCISNRGIGCGFPLITKNVEVQMTVKSSEFLQNV